MTAIVVVSLFYLFIILVNSRKGMTFYESHKNWIDVSLKLLVAISFGIFTFGGYRSFEYMIYPDVLIFESNALRMLIFTLWMMMVIKSFKMLNFEFMLSTLFSGLLIFASNFGTSVISLGLTIAFLPTEESKNKIAIRIMYLLLSGLLIINSLGLSFFSSSDGYLLTTLIILLLLRFNFSWENENTMPLGALMLTILTSLFYFESFNGSRLLFNDHALYSIVGLLLLGYEILMHKRTGAFSLLPSAMIILFPVAGDAGLYSLFLIIFPFLWFFLLREVDETGEVNALEKTLLLIILFTLGLSPFTPGGWSLNMLFSEIAANDFSIFMLVSPLLLFVVLMRYGLSEAYTLIKKESVERENYPITIIDLVLTLVVLSFIYYLSIPDIFSENSAFEFLSVLGNGKVGQVATPWRTKNLLFLFSILFPILIFGLVFWSEKKKEFLQKLSDSTKLKGQGFIKGRLPFFEEGFAVKTHLLSVRARNRSEWLLRGVLYTPSVFIFEVVGTFGSFLGRMRPKGINSNLLYSIVISAIMLMFYLRKLL